ncbi:MAG: choice-of-anchor E domain-containing protein [Paracoccaceae bacterium]
MLSKLLLSTAFIAGMGAAASAATVTFTQTLGDQTTNFTDRSVGSIAQFDASLGTLNSATITLLGTVSGSVSYESLDAAPSDVTTNISAEIGLSTSALGSLIVVLPTQEETRSATVFDGSVDFAGTSGGSITNLTADLSDSVVLTGASLAEFIGNGFVDFSLEGTGVSSASGPGNLATIFQTFAGGTVTVTYDFSDAPAPVPLPAGGLLLLSGLAGMSVMKRKKKQSA